MKKFCFLAVTLVACAAMFVACDPNSPNNSGGGSGNRSNDNPLVGTWEYTKTDIFTTTFNADMTFDMRDYVYADKTKDCAYMEGTYTIDKDIITAHHTGHGWYHDGEKAPVSTFEPFDEEILFGIKGDTLTLVRRYGRDDTFTEVYHRADTTSTKPGEDLPPTPDPIGVDIPAGTIDVHQAIDIALGLENMASTEEFYYVKGWVHSFDSVQHSRETYEEDFVRYGNEYLYLSTRKDGLDTKLFYCYRLVGKLGCRLPDHETVKVGDFIVVKCKIHNYRGTAETINNCEIYSSSNAHFNTVYPPFGDEIFPQSGEISVQQAVTIAQGLEDKAKTEESYRIRGKVIEITTTADAMTQYGNCTFRISSDGITTATCYQTYYKSNLNKFTNANQIQVGDVVVVNGPIQNYGGICETYRGFVEQSSNPNF